MKYKILIIKNRLKKKIDFSKGIKYFKDNTPIELVVTEIETDFDLTFQHNNNDTYSGVTVDEKIKIQLRNVIPRNTYHAVCFLYGNKAPGIRVSVTDNIPLYENTEFFEVVNLGDKGLTFNHEIFHTFFQRLASKGIHLEDSMDKVELEVDCKTGKPI